LPKLSSKLKLINLSLLWLIKSAKKRKYNKEIEKNIIEEINDAASKIGLSYLEKIKHYQIIIENKNFIRKKKK